MTANNQQITVWEIYVHLETTSKLNRDPIPVDSIRKKFDIERDILVGYLNALYILELIDFSDKEKVTLCN